MRSLKVVGLALVVMFAMAATAMAGAISMTNVDAPTVNPYMISSSEIIQITVDYTDDGTTSVERVFLRSYLGALHGFPDSSGTRLYSSDTDGSTTFTLDTTGWDAASAGSGNIKPRVLVDNDGSGDPYDGVVTPYLLMYVVDGEPPVVSAGNDVLAFPGDVVGLSASASDNSTPANQLTYEWIGATADPLAPHQATVDVPEGYFDEDITVTVTDLNGNSGSDSVRVREIGGYIADMLPPGLQKIMEKGGVGR